MHIYEYLFTAIIIVTMILASSIVAETITSPQGRISETEQLKVTAQKIMNQILFDPGDPVDWGSNHNVAMQQLLTFGLGQHSETTRGAYVLDQDKILRLSNETNTDPTLRPIISGLLNLGNDYGVAIEFATPLIVDVTLSPGTCRYNIMVASQQNGLPVYGATIIARLYYVNSGQVAGSSQIVTLTDTTGNCIVDFGNLTAQSKSLVLAVDYSNTLVVKVVADKTAAILGGEIYSTTPLDVTRTACQAIVTNLDGTYAIQSVNSSIAPTPDGWYQLGTPEPATVATLAVANGDLVCASEDVSNATYSSISVNFQQLTNPVSYSIQRSVTINELTYVITLYVWRMSY